MMEKLPSVKGELQGVTSISEGSFERHPAVQIFDGQKQAEVFFLEVSGAEDSGLFFLHGNGSVALLELVRVF